MNLYFISHMIQSGLFPPGLNIFTGLMGISLIRYAPRICKSLLLFSILSLWFFSTPIIAQYLLDYFQNQYPILDVTAITPDEKQQAAIVILGGGNNHMPEMQSWIVSEDTWKRINYAAYLSKQLHLPILTSGGGIHESKESDVMKETLEHLFRIPVLDYENQSINTHDEAVLLKPILIKHQLKTIYLVTSAYHMARSVYAFQQTGIKIIPAPSGYMNILGDKPRILVYCPSISALNVSVIAWHEAIGLVWYHLYYHDQQA